ncbi:MAG: hypothetical protein QS748_07595 [Candidatus Endonucleobacter bathymodioli]|uniref:Uncharacterized protein n=1 Tax=Candidatus Endonucleibacter bathymodioli TaxID=539814 RepID=A0AA90NVM8_9GAMM|nr:hypothetical protein [Candidatus Endonucleobacter bathymodioli]
MHGKRESLYAYKYSSEYVFNEALWKKTILQRPHVVIQITVNAEFTFYKNRSHR